MSERCTQCKWQVTWTGALFSLSQLSPMPWSLTEPETTYLVDAPVKEENESQWNVEAGTGCKNLVGNILRDKALSLGDAHRKVRVTPAEDGRQWDDNGGRPDEQNHQANSTAIATLVNVVHVGHCPKAIL